ncbi:hypothetical protein SAMN05443144_109142 [Fodinibius roseus]|uniref:Uncharacterized protein n=1 Tax=Fodinibius roseus TaxID=1194090 RepID=A0A1M5C918_9BACT|nr:hypothetical protein [Fodinibius roseus]SHF51160.1 hypothetical protein SAMN05443144_109142 [Fodinibius roseus]
MKVPLLRIGYLCIIIMTFQINNVVGQVSAPDKGSFSGLIFSDYYWFAESHNADLKGKNGFWFRRIYFTYDHEISNSFSSRLRLEMSSPGDFASNEKMTPVVKDIFLRWERAGHQITAGISSTPIFGLIEDVWGYRPVEKAPQDLFGFGSSRDFGVSFKGALGSDQQAGYHLFIGNGNSNKAELNKGKKIMLALSYNLTDHLVLQVYGDWDDRPGSSDWKTVQGFSGYQSEHFNFGISYTHQIRENINNSLGDNELDLVSLFTNMELTDNIKGFARADHLFDPVLDGESISYLPMSSAAESATFLVGGVDLSLHENIHLIPNVETVVYGENEAGVRPNSDIVPRLTLFYTF